MEIMPAERNEDTLRRRNESPEKEDENQREKGAGVGRLFCLNG
jgi:hypothetical protein